MQPSRTPSSSRSAPLNACLQWPTPPAAESGSEQFQPCSFVIKPASAAWESTQAYALRRAVFCDEQGLFSGDDRDAIDARAQLLVAVAQVAGMPDHVVGTVRIHEQTPGTWYGSRLAVDRDYRRHGGLGSGLIELAVRTAHSRAARVFLAHVQAPNVPLFVRLHWQSLEEVTLHGMAHHFMRANLTHYPPLANPAAGLLVVNRRAA